MRPQALLLDIGNVVVRLRPDGWLERLGQACAPERGAQEMRAWMHRPSGAHFLHERGHLDGPGFHQALRDQLGFAPDYRGWLDIWNDYFGTNEPMEALLQGLKGQVRLWALSNSNPQHLDHLKRQFNILSHFEGVTASHETNVAKPDPAIFQAALWGLGLPAAKVLFVDDSADYVEAGRALGLQVFRYQFNDAALQEHLVSLGLG